MASLFRGGWFLAPLLLFIGLNLSLAAPAPQATPAPSPSDSSPAPPPSGSPNGGPSGDQPTGTDGTPTFPSTGAGPPSTNRFASPIGTDLPVPSSLSGLLPSPSKGSSNGQDGGREKLSVAIPLGVLLPLFFVALLVGIWRYKGADCRGRWRERRRRRGMIRTGSTEPEMSQRAGAGATVNNASSNTGNNNASGTGQGENNGQSGGRRNRRRRNPSIRTVPEYSEDANDTEIVLARADTSSSLPSTTPYETDDEQRHLLRRSTSALPSGSDDAAHDAPTARTDPTAGTFEEVDLAAAAPAIAVTQEATQEPAEPPPDYDRHHASGTDEALPAHSRRASTVSMPESHNAEGDLSLPRTATASTTDLSRTTSQTPPPHSGQRGRGSALRNLFGGGAGNGSSTSLLPVTRTMDDQTSASPAHGGRARPPSAFRTRRHRILPSSSSLASLTSSSSHSHNLPFLNTPNRPRAGSSSSNLTISSPLPETFAQGAYRYPTSDGFRPTPEQMRFLGSVEELNRVGAGPFYAAAGQSRSSLSLVRTRSRSSTNGGGASAGAEEEVPPPPFVDLEQAGSGRQRSVTEGTTNRAPLWMPSYPREAASNTTTPAAAGLPDSTESARSSTDSAAGAAESGEQGRIPGEASAEGQAGAEALEVEREVEGGAATPSSDA